MIYNPKEEGLDLANIYDLDIDHLEDGYESEDLEELADLSFPINDDF